MTNLNHNRISLALFKIQIPKSPLLLTSHQILQILP